MDDKFLKVENLFCSNMTQSGQNLAFIDNKRFLISKNFVEILTQKKTFGAKRVFFVSLS